MKKRRFLKIALLLVVLGSLTAGGGHVYYKNAPPSQTCASCHEINSSYESWTHSSHRDVSCFDCHGTALSNGIHSLMEKGRMVFMHVTREMHSDDIQPNEDQFLEINERCVKCHTAEHAEWLAGGHSATYTDIFLDSHHNSEELLYRDCLRCHGMFYDDKISDLVTPLDMKGPWHLKQPEWAAKPTMPCLACHQVHTPDPMSLVSTEGGQEGNRAAPQKFQFYDRHTGGHLTLDQSLVSEFYDDEKQVMVSPDPRQTLCVQCHAPNSFHQVGSSDDRTPTGVHEGLSCMACHKVHSGETSHSCANCHPAMSNCGLDVTLMDTSFLDSDSAHNIHFVSCVDCHTEGVPKPETVSSETVSPEEGLPQEKEEETDATE